MKKCFVLELNEICLDLFERYASGKKNSSLMVGLNKFKTSKYELVEGSRLEPWIQWPILRTGNDLETVTHLGDELPGEIRQYWEIFEEKGFSVEAISPINGYNRTEKSKFWIPDPWVETQLSGPVWSRLLHSAVKRLVCNNVKSFGANILDKVLFLLIGFWVMSWATRIWLLSNFFRILKKKWMQSIVLDRVLFDLAVRRVSCNRDDKFLCSVFLNSVAHIQHHYLLSSPYVEKDCASNPAWYDFGEDPLVDSFDSIEYVFNCLVSLSRSGTRVIVGTGLVQAPVSEPFFYWRLSRPTGFLSALDIKFISVDSLMSRDFSIHFNSKAELLVAERKLGGCLIGDVPVFKLDRQSDRQLFVELIYPRQIDQESILCSDTSVINISDHVDFVAIKNGKHAPNAWVIADFEMDAVEAKNDSGVLFFDMLMALAEDRVSVARAAVERVGVGAQK